ncbi:MAG: hypothetical protein HOY78_24950 [Saccharothrix sp.]|nr:hypothetical protein [Saccharothrix sp.]
MPFCQPSVHAAAPHAKVITIGYPSVLPTTSDDCAWGDLTELATITKADVDWLWGVHANLNQFIKYVTEERGDNFVDLAASSAGHDACQPADTKWVEGICGPAQDFWPPNLPLPGGITLPCPEGTRATLVHPNAAGHANAAEQVETAIRAALSESRPSTTTPTAVPGPVPGTAAGVRGHSFLAWPGLVPW